MKLVPVPKDAPPDAAAYQLMVPVLAAAPKETVPASQRDPAVVELIVGLAFTVIVLVAVVVEQDPPLVVNVNVIELVSEAPAVYVAVDTFDAFVHVPAPPDHVPPVAPPPVEPPIAADTPL